MADFTARPRMFVEPHHFGSGLLRTGSKGKADAHPLVDWLNHNRHCRLERWLPVFGYRDHRWVCLHDDPDLPARALPGVPPVPERFFLNQGSA